MSEEKVYAEGMANVIMLKAFLSLSSGTSGSAIPQITEDEGVSVEARRSLAGMVFEVFERWGIPRGAQAIDEIHRLGWEAGVRFDPIDLEWPSLG